MLTSLSRSIREVLNKLRARPAAPALHALPPALDLTQKLPPAKQPMLRLVGAAGHPDISITPPAPKLGASAFVAGQGARLYSLDAFRKGQRRGPRHPRAA